MRDKLFVLLIFFLLLFVYTKISGPITINSVTTQKDTTFDVTGEGSVLVTPDIAKISAGVSANAPTVKGARDQMNTVINRVSQSVKNLGVDGKDIQTTSYNIYPSFDSQRISGYQASTNLSIKVRKIENINNVIDVVTEAGANQVGSVSFDIDDKTKAENTAREKAVEQAKQKAQNASRIGGFTLGRLVNYSEGFQPQIPIRAMGAVLNKAESVPTQVETGTNEIKVSVTLSYEIR